jgi:hypothetical protein
MYHHSRNRESYEDEVSQGVVRFNPEGFLLSRNWEIGIETCVSEELAIETCLFSTKFALGIIFLI